MALLVKVSYRSLAALAGVVPAIVTVASHAARAQTAAQVPSPPPHLAPATSAASPIPPPGSLSVIAPPVALEAGPVPYPEGGHGDAVVVCEIVVDEAGAVKSARILEGEEPFATAVLTATTSFRFQPAMRGAQPVVARIRMRVDLRPPVPAPAEPTATSTLDGGATGPGAPPTSRAETLDFEEVLVQGARHEVAQTSLGGGEVRQMPGAFGDAFRAMEALPGVTPIVSGLPFFFVRGAPPGNVGYFLDGVRVPLLYHLGFGPSVIHPALIDRVDFFAGGYPAQYGRFAGGILAGETLRPAARAHGEANVRLFDAGALVEAPFANGRGTVLVGGRYSYTAALLSLAAPDTRLQYWDYQGRATWELSKRDRIGVFVFGSYDDLKNRSRKDGDFEPVFNTQFHRVDLRYDRTLEGGRLRIAATLGVDSTLFQGDSSSEGQQTNALRERMLATRVEYEKKLSDTLRLRAGADGMFQRYDLVTDVLPRGGSRGSPVGDGAPSPEQTDAAVGGGMSRPQSPQRDDPSGTTIQDLYPPRNEVVGGVRADVIWKPLPRVEIVPGMRFDLFVARRSGGMVALQSAGSRGGVPADTTTATTPAIDPRLAVRLGVAANVTWISTLGVSHQPPSFFVPVPGFRPGSLGTGLQTSVQMSQGVEVTLPWEITGTVTAFVHNYLDLMDITATCSQFSDIDDSDESCVEQRVRGRAVGFEVLVRRSLTKRFTGWLSYTLSRSTRQTRPIRLFRSMPALAASEILSEFDRTHVFSAVGAFDLGRGWRAGARFFLYSGRPYTQTFSGYPIPPFNSARMPGFYRLDVRLEKKWRIGDTGSISFVIEGLNVLLKKEVIGVRCDPAVSTDPPIPYTTPRPDPCRFEEVGPISVPSLGLEGAF